MGNRTDQVEPWNAIRSSGFVIGKHRSRDCGPYETASSANDTLLSPLSQYAGKDGKANSSQSNTDFRPMKRGLRWLGITRCFQPLECESDRI